MLLPFPHKTFPPTLHLIVIEFFNVYLFLNVEVEREQGAEGRQVVPRYLACAEWEGLPGDGAVLVPPRRARPVAVSSAFMAVG